MSIYATHTEKPTNCEECWFSSQGNYKIYCGIYMQDMTFADRPSRSCPVIEMKKHGRLIDADELEKELERLGIKDNWVYNTLHHAPTVIPAGED